MKKLLKNLHRQLRRYTLTVFLACWLQLIVLKCLMDVASGMTYLHSMGILHGDLKSANVLLKSTATDLRGFQCKIADFGCAKC